MATIKKPVKKISPFQKPSHITREYERSLRKVAREVGRIIEGFQAESFDKFNLSSMNKHLEDYAVILKPWAEFKGRELAARLDKQDYTAWMRSTEEMSASIRNEIKNTDVGRVFRDIMARQVELITSLPLDESKRVHKLVIDGLSDSRRAEEIAKEIARSGEVTESRAMTIARTETTRGATSFTQARATSTGGTHYIWRSVHDGRVRMRHKELDGTIQRWDAPPVASEEGAKEVIHAHPGEIYNCRCRPEPIIPNR